MAKGRPMKWAHAKIAQGFWLNRSGIEIEIWDKYGRRKRGTCIISIGGIKWRSFRNKRLKKFSWDTLDNNL